MVKRRERQTSKKQRGDTCAGAGCEVTQDKGCMRNNGGFQREEEGGGGERGRPGVD